jgi:hypothetical protein
MVTKSSLNRRSRLAWCLTRRGWNLRTWRKTHWSDESRFLHRVTDGRMRVWRHKNTAYSPRNIQPTVQLFLLTDVYWAASVVLSTGLVANGIRLTKRCNALSSRSDVTRGLPLKHNNIYIDYRKNNVPLKRCAHTGVTITSNID